jgi:hypothetical protein
MNGRFHMFQAGDDRKGQDQDSPSLEASIWQHLNSLDKANTLPLSPFAISLWAQIPEEKVEEIQWENPSARSVSNILLNLAMWETLIWGAAIYLKLDVTSPIFVISTIPLWSAFYNLILIRRISVLNDRIEASTAFGKSDVPWKLVRSLNFVVWFGRPVSMLIRAGMFCSIRIPWLPEHPNSTRVMLAIIRRLRQEERFKLLSFPAVLLVSTNSGEGDVNF